MNKTAIKNFAVWAREKLIKDVKYRAGMIGINENGIAEALPQSTKDLKFFDIGTKNYAEVSGDEIDKRDALVNAIKNKERKVSGYEEAFNYIVEEVAYTWFNRLIAIRFMEVNGYLPSGVRVLSSENKAKKEPDMVTTPFDTDMEFTPFEQDRIIQLKDENKLDELFRILFIKQCNKLNEILPELFEETDDFTEPLLSISFTDEDGIIYKLVHDIDEDDFNIEKEGQVEIIGWMYQYYNIEPKAAVFAKPKGTKIKKEEIPAATQLFTPDWIVRYMVENSLGRLWIEGHENNNLKSNWKYYLDEAQQESEVEKQLETIRNEYKNITPESIKLIDPCMGSGHILVYAFDVFMQIYESYGYAQREAAKSILENNIYGIDIDKRAYQLSYFAIMMKARQYNRRILTQGIIPNLVVTENSGKISDSALDRLGECKGVALHLLDDFRNVEEYGSLLNVSYSQTELDELINKIDEIGKNISNLIDSIEVEELKLVFLPLVRQARLLSRKYHIAVTNPPYKGSNEISNELNNYMKIFYSNGKSDLFSAFIDKCYLLTTKYCAMVTPTAWMFNPRFVDFREDFLSKTMISSLIELGDDAFEVGFGTVMFVLEKIINKNYIAKFIDASSTPDKQNFINEVKYLSPISSFVDVEDMKISYKLSKQLVSVLKSSPKLQEFCYVGSGLQTNNNPRFIRDWFELNVRRIDFHHRAGTDYSREKRWYPTVKNTSSRKWYGNFSSVVNWENDGKEIKELATEKYGSYTRHVKNQKFYFHEGLTWSHSTYGMPYAIRVLPEGWISNVEGPAIFELKHRKKYTLALLNSKIAMTIFGLTTGSIHVLATDVSKFPYIFSDNKLIDSMVENNINISKSDWDSFETSWDFIKHPLLKGNTIKSAFEDWYSECEDRFNTLKANEEELNRIFIDIYGLQDELTPEVLDKDVTVRKADLKRDIKSFISYAVGCMFGRYSLDVDGLAYAGGEWDNSKYSSFVPDADNCIPITDEEYFEDDIVGRFVDFVKVVYGKEMLEENLDFIAKALGTKGNTSIEIIRNYFLNGFIKDHIKTYQKRPIYWLFDSGKQNGFKALVYMHRYNADTIGNMRVEYLHHMQRVYEKEMERMQEVIDNSRDNKEINAATKRKEKLQKQYKEAKDYDAKVAHLALSRIDIDLDDGVKVNYEKVQTASNGTKHQILVKI